MAEKLTPQEPEEKDSKLFGNLEPGISNDIRAFADLENNTYARTTENLCRIALKLKEKDPALFTELKYSK